MLYTQKHYNTVQADKNHDKLPHFQFNPMKPVSHHMYHPRVVVGQPSSSLLPMLINYLRIGVFNRDSKFNSNIHRIWWGRV